MKIYQLLCLALLGISVVGCGSSNSSTKTPEMFDEASLSLVLMLDKSSYKMSEVIKANLTLSEKEINARMIVDSDVVFVIMTPSGRKAGFLIKIRVFPPIDNDFVVLYSKHSIQAEYNLEELYQLNETGIYTVYAIYENHFDPNNGLTAWKGKIETNTLQFEIK
jgi:hypothetical protein